MNIAFYFDYLRRSNLELKNLSKKINTNILYLWYDFVKASIAHGAILQHYCRGGFHQLKGVERRKSMTYRRICKVYKQCNNPEYQHLLDNKADFNKFFSEYINRLWLYAKEMDYSAFKRLCDQIGGGNALIIKPIDGVEGHGIYKVTIPATDDGIKNLFNKLKGQNSLIEECIKQHPQMAYGATSVNTIRPHTIMDKEGNVHLMKCLLRVGVGDTVVDNYCMGGCVYEIDVETGLVDSPSLNKSGKELIIHPGTDICMLGQKIPHWDKIKDFLTSVHKRIPQMRFVGWDLAVTEKGFELIEGNHNPDYELLEFFGSKGWYEKMKPFV